MKRIGLFLPNWIGDVVMATPAIRAVRDAFPSGTRWDCSRMPPMFAGALWFQK